MIEPDAIRLRFPALSRIHNGHPVAYFDGPAGSQVPSSVAEAVAWYLLNNNANSGGPIATSRETDTTLAEARLAMSDLVQTPEPETIIFGANMTSLTFSLSRTIGRTWKPGDEVIVSRLDHDANVTPWVLAAQRAGAVVKTINVRREDCTLEMDSFHAALSNRTRLVAIGLASNATGTLNPVAEIAAAARQVGALTFVDAVHAAPHVRIHVSQLECDFLACSAYKFFGPHVGVLWGRRELLEQLSPDKLRPAPDSLPGKWMTGTQNHEGIAGVEAAVDYLADISGLPADLPRRERLNEAFAAVAEYETRLSRHFLQGLSNLPDFRLWGIRDPTRLHHRVPTFSLTHAKLAPRDMAAELAQRGIFAWAGNHYALPLTETLGLEPQGTLRVGFLHYTTINEIDRLLAELARF